MKIRLRPIVWATGFLILFMVFSKYEDRPQIRSFDFAMTVKIQEKIDRSSRLRTAAFVGNVMEGSSFFASPALTVVATLLGTGILIYNKKKKQWRLAALLIPILLTALVAAEVFGKSIVHHPSPPFSMIKNPITMFPADYVNEQYSYPSGHSARAIFLAFLIYAVSMQLTKPTKKKIVCIVISLGVYVLLVSVSKVYLGHHWASDVIGGILLGMSTGVLVMPAAFGQENTAKKGDRSLLQA